jgi:hypothetical protein
MHRQYMHEEHQIFWCRECVACPWLLLLLNFGRFIRLVLMTRVVPPTGIASTTEIDLDKRHLIAAELRPTPQLGQQCGCLFGMHDEFLAEAVIRVRSVILKSHDNCLCNAIAGRYTRILLHGGGRK